MQLYFILRSITSCVIVCRPTPLAREQLCHVVGQMGLTEVLITLIIDLRPLINSPITSHDHNSR